jgi:hypothetical protein
MADEPTPVSPDETPAEASTPPAKAKKEKPPAKEKPAAEGDAAPKAKKAKADDKPFLEFMQQDYMPALQAALVSQGLADVDLNLKFEKRKINIIGFAQEPECWQVIGRWNSGYKQAREFVLYFFTEDINGPKGFSYADAGGKASTLESFRIDERKADLNLLVFWTVQRLNAQKWLVRN